MPCRTIRFLALLVLSLAMPLAAEAQPLAKVPRIGVLLPYAAPVPPTPLPIVQGLRDLGYVEGQSIAVE